MKVPATICAVILIACGSEAANCTAEERATWYATREFAAQLEAISDDAYGDRSLAEMELEVMFPVLSIPCIQCHGDMLVCREQHCEVGCRQVKEANWSICRNCLIEHCTFPYMMCVGTTSHRELPMGPWEL